MTAPLPWVKLYTKTIGEPEWVEVPADEFGCWAKMLLLAGKSSKRGFVFGSIDVIARAINVEKDLVTKTVARFSQRPFKTMRQLRAGIEFVRFIEHYPPSNFVPGYRSGYKPSIEPTTSAPYREEEEEKRASREEESALAVLEGVRDFPVEDENLAFVMGLFRDYPTLDVLGQIRRWAARKLDDPIRPTSRPRQQITTWMQNAVKWGHTKPAEVREMTAAERRAQIVGVS